MRPEPPVVPAAARPRAEGAAGAEPEPLRPFRFAIGQRVRVIMHAARPTGTVVARWTGAELRDPYGENIYEVSGFVTRQRESSLEHAV
jgi:hypothetical protein